MIERIAHGQRVYLREGTSDEDVWNATFSGLYHVPPAWMPEPETILDLGANIGLVTLDYQSRWPEAKIEAVEMDHDNCQQAVLNGVEPLEAAVVADLEQAAGYDRALAEEAFALGSGACQPRARYTLAQLAYPAVDFVKMDVEGTEWALLDQPDWAAFVKYLIVELHGDLPNPERRLLAATKLARLGFDSEASSHPAGLFAWRSGITSG